MFVRNSAAPPEPASRIHLLQLKPELGLRIVVGKDQVLRQSILTDPDYQSGDRRSARSVCRDLVANARHPTLTHDTKRGQRAPVLILRRPVMLKRNRHYRPFEEPQTPSNALLKRCV